MNTLYDNYQLKPELEILLSNESAKTDNPSFGFMSDEVSFSAMVEKDTVKDAISKGERNENKLSDLLFFKRHPELAGKLLKQGQPNFDKLSREWVRIRDVIVRPLLLSTCKINTVASASVPAIAFRPCCILSSHIPSLSGVVDNFLEPGFVGQHGSATERSGIIYTGRAGFVDLGHVRESCDITKAVFDQLTASASGPPSSVSSKNGTATLKKCAINLMAIAKAISYDEGKGHEITTFNLSSAGGHNSSFSPEDLCSNFLGTVVAERAIKSGGSFNTSVTKQIDDLLTHLDAQTKSESINAFGLVKNRWVNFIDEFSVLKNDYLRRRSFSHIPWKTGHKSDKQTPLFITQALPDFSSVYEFTYTEFGVTVPKKDWGKEIAKIKTKARVLYGTNFDKK